MSKGYKTDKTQNTRTPGQRGAEKKLPESKTVQEFFQTIGTRDVNDAYEIRYGTIEESAKTHGFSTEELVELLSRRRIFIGSIIWHIRNCVANKSDKVLFVLYMNRLSFAEREETDTVSFCVSGKEAARKIKKPAWKDEGKDMIERSSYGMDRLSDIAAYRIARATLENVAELDIATEIMHEIVNACFDMSKTQGEIREIVSQLIYEEDETEEVPETPVPETGEGGTWLPADQIVEDMKQSIIDESGAGDEQWYLRCQLAFYEMTGDLEYRHVEAVTNKLKETEIEYMKEEFTE